MPDARIATGAAACAEADDALRTGQALRQASPLARALLRLLAVYQSTATIRRPRCRFLPTCSSYAAEAIERHGVRRGLGLATRRVCRCHPLGSFGFDPVPDPEV